MSEFTCSSFCEPVSSDTKQCPVCGKPITHMDGFSSRQWEMMEIDAEQDALESEKEDNCY